MTTPSPRRRSPIRTLYDNTPVPATATSPAEKRPGRRVYTRETPYAHRPSRENETRLSARNTTLPARTPRRSLTTTPQRTPVKRSSRLPARPVRNLPSARKDEFVPPVPENAVRIIPLGGVEEVGKNMLMVETPHDIVVSDVGFQFVSDEEAPGVDYVLPNTKYLEDRKDKIRAVLITHGHLDHIGGIPYIMERIGNPPIYCTEVTALMIKKRQEEFPHLPKLDIHVVDRTDKIVVGQMVVRFFPVTHSISDSCGVIVETEHGNVVISGDLKLEHEEGVPTKREEKVWSAVGKGKNILFIGDSTNAEKGGFSIPESVVHRTLEEIITDVKGRVIIGMFASQFERMIHVIQVCEKLNKKVVTEGRSIKNNLEIAKLANRVKIRPDTVIQAEEIHNYPSERIVILSTGAQGEEFAGLMRIATGKHRFITFNERDTVVLSSSVIPGNELSVQKLKDNLYRHGLRVIHYRASDVHSTGHGNTGELVWIREHVQPRFFMPGYGFHSMIRCHAQAQVDAGFPKERVIIPETGMVIDIINGEELHILEVKAPNASLMVDGLSVGDVQDVVIRDRRTLAQDGMFVVIATVNARTGELRKSPDIISRGFVYLRESQGLLNESRLVVRKAIEHAVRGMNPVNFEYVRDAITQEVGKFLLERTNKRPIIIPVVLGL